jgi:hypothetical protein
MAICHWTQYGVIGAGWGHEHESAGAPHGYGSAHSGASGTPYLESSAITPAAFSPIMIVGAWVQAFSAAGMIEASATRSPCSPITRSRGSTTAAGSLPMRHVPLGWKAVAARARMSSSIAACSLAIGPGVSSESIRSQIGGPRIMSRMRRTERASARRSSG